MCIFFLHVSTIYYSENQKIHGITQIFQNPKLTYFNAIRIDTTKLQDKNKSNYIFLKILLHNNSNTIWLNVFFVLTYMSARFNQNK